MRISRRTEPPEESIDGKKKPEPNVSHRPTHKLARRADSTAIPEFY